MVIRVLALSVVLLAGSGPAPLAEAESIVRLGDQFTAHVLNVPARLWVGEEYSFRIVFKNHSNQDIAAPGGFGAVAFFRVSDVTCGGNQVWQRPGTSTSTPPGVEVVFRGGDRCGINHSLGGTVPARSQATFVFTTTTLNPGVIPLDALGQTYETRVVARK
jgi:hypothetical protein